MTHTWTAGTEHTTASTPVSIAVGVVVVLVIAGILYRQYRLKQRVGEGFAQLAAERGWEYDHKAGGLEHRYIQYPFGGPTPQANFAFRGVHRGREFLSFQYQYTDRWDDEQGNAQTKTHYFHVTGILTPAPRPILQTTIADWSDRLASKLGAALGVDFQSANPEFNRRFHVETEDVGFARALLEPEIAAWAPTEDALRWLPFRFERQDLMTWSEWADDPSPLNWLRSSPAKLDPENILPMLDLLCDVLDRTPAEVWQ